MVTQARTLRRSLRRRAAELTAKCRDRSEVLSRFAAAVAVDSRASDQR